MIAQRPLTVPISCTLWAQAEQSLMVVLVTMPYRFGKVRLQHVCITRGFHVCQGVRSGWKKSFWKEVPLSNVVHIHRLKERIRHIPSQQNVRVRKSVSDGPEDVSVANVNARAYRGDAISGGRQVVPVWSPDPFEQQPESLRGAMGKAVFAILAVQHSCEDDLKVSWQHAGNSS
jgi:hypothetical protein